MKVLLTGASGYLGARLVRYLINKNQMDELFLGSRSGKCTWLDGLGTQVAFDLGNPELPDGIDKVIHLAALNEIDCADTSSALKVNVEGTWKLIENAVRQRVKGFVYASTIHVYGPLTGHLTESSLPVARHPYGFTHHMSEQLFEYASVKYGMPSICLRFSNVVGAPADKQVNRWTLLVNDLCRQAVTTHQLILRSPQSQRDFISVADACAAIHRALVESGGLNPFEVFNISMGANTKVQDIAELIARRATALLGKHVSIVSDASGGNPSDDFLLDNIKAKKWGWLPHGDLQDEIDQTLRLCLEAK